MRASSSFSFCSRRRSTNLVNVFALVGLPVASSRSSSCWRFSRSTARRRIVSPAL
ncbi:hypothetical protein PF005_g2528 [Phytophthora fragariae]|uniref:Uncharacterized protein n=1 Tax=Phytophthora fragariae TaxID=53985 RepID=A0A6A3UJI4_9STRA|nr:hypothetical protein PF003_g8258 [Phytophthora fragariae]KAE8939907.1 hypothetical protein PF009_g10268 [Phytophthora fragariae]KAE9014134.1 hypothetical protein PF011_g8192 [Phytophthora fragariae]KAE9117363.1 hypothetical protein PF010_g8636 [Phytophthora fragariae]KAE9135744.1 hypothetical protein PF007_g2448 [Phytophthora fragariae]